MNSGMIAASAAIFGSLVGRAGVDRRHLDHTTAPRHPRPASEDDSTPRIALFGFHHGKCATARRCYGAEQQRPAETDPTLCVAKPHPPEFVRDGSGNNRGGDTDHRVHLSKTKSDAGADRVPCRERRRSAAPVQRRLSEGTRLPAAATVTAREMADAAK